MVHDWIGWGPIYVSDPDNNTPEFVSYDQSGLGSTSVTSLFF
jgi:hypothetical protein